MGLTPRTRLGSYEILSAIGAGGMGEIYQATNLKQAVALRFLPAALARDADRLARFPREAEVLGALNYPRIAVNYGLERLWRTTARVMELVRLARVPSNSPSLNKGSLPQNRLKNHHRRDQMATTGT